MTKYRKLTSEEYDAYQTALNTAYDALPFLWNYFINIVPITVDNRNNIPEYITSSIPDSIPSGILATILSEQHFFIDPFGRMCVPFIENDAEIRCPISSELLFHHILHFLNKTHFLVEEDVADDAKLGYSAQTYTDGHCLCINSVLTQTVKRLREDTVKYQLTIPKDAFTPTAVELPENLSVEEYITKLLDAPPLPNPEKNDFTLRCIHALFDNDELSNIDDAMPRMNSGAANDMRQNLKLDMLSYLRDNTVTGSSSSKGSTADKIIIEYLQGKKPKVSWQDVLSGVVRGRKSDTGANIRSDYSKSRRYNPTNFILPGLSGIYCDVLVGVDTSYSMVNLLPHILTEVAVILEEQNVPTKFFSVDTEIDNISLVDSIKDIDISCGGGTDMRVAYQYAASVECDMFILFTDGETPYPKVNPCSCQVVTCIVSDGSLSYSADKPDFGTVIEVEYEIER